MSNVGFVFLCKAKIRIKNKHFRPKGTCIKKETRFNLQIVVFKEFKVANKVSSFVGIPVFLLISSKIKGFILSQGYVLF